MSSERSERVETRLRGSGTVPRVFAWALLAAVTVFDAIWFIPAPSIGPVLVELVALALAIRSLFVGVSLDGPGILVRAWFRTYRYGPGELTTVTVLPYWKFLDAKDPILSLLKFTPAEGWVREVAATVAWKDRTLAHAAEIRRHLGLDAE